jgi:uncharacterized protein YkvS
VSVLRIAEVNDLIQSIKGIVGIVEKIRENTVIISILENPTDVFYEDNVTVINHKNYQILQRTPESPLYEDDLKQNEATSEEILSVTI